MKVNQKTEVSMDAVSNPFDPSLYRVSQDYAATGAVKKSLAVVRVNKPDKTWFVRVNPDPNYHMDVFVFELKEDNETYMVLPAMVPELGEMATPKALYIAKNRQGVLFVWPVKLPDHEGKIDDWNKSAMEAVSLARDEWVSLRSNRSAGYYDVLTAAVPLSEPDWSDLPPFSKILEVAFKGRLIDSPDHPVLKRLRGEV